jgi:hypothetical protein
MKKTIAKSGKKSIFLETAKEELEQIIEAGIEQDSLSLMREDLLAFLLAKCKESFKNGIEVGMGVGKKRNKQ